MLLSMNALGVAVGNGRGADGGGIGFGGGAGAQPQIAPIARIDPIAHNRSSERETDAARETAEGRCMERSLAEVQGTGMSNPTSSRPESQNHLEPGLFVTATPIGNARDITLRALDVLRHCDAILTEDTRVTAKLLAIHAISRPLFTYNDHNGARVRPAILARLAAGARIALVSDAGMPLVSDPGYKLVREALAADERVHVIPGASAVLAALVISGLPTDRFLFGGFLPTGSSARRSVLEELKPLRSSLIFFDSPRRLAGTLRDLLDVLGARQAAVVRELTKLHEEVCRDDLTHLASRYARKAPRGEITIVIGPAEPEAPDLDRLDELLDKALAFMPVRAAADLVSEALGVPRRTAYSRALTRKAGPPDGF
jgi:16S rRNA (cytidine1402-2'-O)-methyltransferase